MKAGTPAGPGQESERVTVVAPSRARAGAIMRVGTSVQIQTRL